jgi:hypothetical protein
MTRNEKKLANRICATSPQWADEPLGAIVMKVGLWHDIRTVLIGSKFGIDRSSGFQSADPRNSAFPIESFHRLYNTRRGRSRYHLPLEKTSTDID